MSQRKIYNIQKSGRSPPGVNDPPIVRRGGGTIFLEFMTKLFYGVFYLAVVVLASVGATTLLNGHLRDILFELVKNTFFTL